MSIFNEFSDHMKRVHKELEELEVKLEKLSQFVRSDAFDSLDGTSKVLLIRQAKAMAEYIEILNTRVCLEIVKIRKRALGDSMGEVKS
tara:strand:+ start:683 stop:946 length:264 start_codon:yes stop_codon:yes gene_type:complete